MNSVRFSVTILCTACAVSACGTPRAAKPDISHGLSQSAVLSLWGQPQERAFIGTMPRTHYPVEVWAYYDTRGRTQKDDEYLLLFVDGELYAWSKNDPDSVLQELARLNVMKQAERHPPTNEYRERLRTTAEQAEQTRRAMDVIRMYQQYESTRMGIETYHQMRILQQQQLRPVLPPPQPERPIRRQQ